MDEFSLTGKTILVTGASSGIGREVAIRCSKLGAEMVITGRDPERLHVTRDALRVTGNTVTRNASRVTDLTVEADMDELVASLPVLNGIVHCAGIVGPLPSKFITRADIDKMFGINYYAPVNLTSKILRKTHILAVHCTVGQRQRSKLIPKHWHLNMLPAESGRTVSWQVLLTHP